MGKDLHKVFKAMVNDIPQALPIFGEFISEVYYFIQEPRKFVEVIRLSENIKKILLKAIMKEI